MVGEDIAVLRCKFCGAPFSADAIRSDDKIVTCEFCGTSQQRIDAEKYMNDIIARVQAWVSKSLPMGFSMAGSMTIDPVARHSIFAKDIGPKISVELMTYRMSLYTLLGNRLLVMPFRSIKVCQISTTSNSAFEFNAKVKSVSELAVTDEDIKLVNDASYISECYALAVNNVILLDEQKDGRWGIMAHNFEEAANALNNEKEFANPAKRLFALSKICDGFQKMFSGDSASGFGLVKEGKEGLESMKNDVMSDAQFCMMYNAIEQEINISRIILNILDHTNSTGGDCLRTLDVIKNVMDAPTCIKDPNWGYILHNLHRYEEIFTNIADVLAADDGDGVPIAQGDGNVLMPMWEVELRYTFVTGKLWAKRSVEVREPVFASAMFILDPGCISNPRSALTDIFKNKPEVRFMDSLQGKETSISGSGELANIGKSIITAGPSGRKILLPITRKMEAEKICGDYLKMISTTDDKLRLSAPVVKRLVYVPCKVENDRFVLPSSFGNLVPAHLIKMKASEIRMI